MSVTLNMILSILSVVFVMMIECIFLNDLATNDFAMLILQVSLFFFFKDPAPPEISPLPLHDALPISWAPAAPAGRSATPPPATAGQPPWRIRLLSSAHENQQTAHITAAVVELSAAAALSTPPEDRKSTRLNSSHGYISYAVFCLKKKK